MLHDRNHGGASTFTGAPLAAPEPGDAWAAVGATAEGGRMPLQLAAALLLGGVLLSAVAGSFHPGREDPNDHRAAFTEYAASAEWTAVHLGQFVGMAVLVAGLLALAVALDAHRGAAAWLSRGGAVTAAVALALYGALQAVDGVALKRAVDAWVVAPDAERAARFASAEALRWLEWGVRSYQSIALGFAFLLFGAAIAAAAQIPRPIGALLGLSGLAYLAQGWTLGEAGFAAANTAPTLLGIATALAWSTWLLVAAWRRWEPANGTTARASRWRPSHRPR
jgi:hypothetical protein